MSETGVDLARAYHQDVVAPLLQRSFPGMAYAVGRLGSGSDVLGLDDVMSRDHDWGLRLTLLVPDDAVGHVDELLNRDLPADFRGHPTRFATTWAPQVRSQVEVDTAVGFARSRLGLDACVPLDLPGWLSLSGQAVLEVTAGPIFGDGLGEISAIRDRLTWYPHDLWLYAISSDWSRLGEELPFLGRTAERGDVLGSALITAALVRTAMHLGFLLERHWAPYSKWFGTMFAELPIAADLAPLLDQTLAAQDWRDRERHLAQALELLGTRQGAVGVPTREPVVEAFYDRPYCGVQMLAEHVLTAVTDPQVRALPIGVGTAEQWSDNVKVVANSDHRTAAVRQWLGLRTPE